MERSREYEAVIGLEVHAQLLTRTKIFCGCPAEFGAEPNTLTCPVCLGLPGALPVLNSRAVDMAVRVGLALGCRIAGSSVFARKNYFYPDCPKNYQISMYDRPLCEDGWLEIDSDRGRVGIPIERIHLEEDAGKLVHDAGGSSLVDFNRCGIPLVEIVTRPEIRSAGEAVDFLKKLRRVLRYLDVCDGNLEEGSMRCDVNVSLKKAGEKDLGTKTEIKNLNSLKAVESGIRFEIDRQERILVSGGRIGKVTSLWDESRKCLLPLRSKEEADDYRYFPEPDLLCVEVGDDAVRRASRDLPELPEARKSRFVSEYGLSMYEAGVLTAEKGVADYFERVAASAGDYKTSCNWVMREILGEIKGKERGMSGFPVRAEQLASLIRLIIGGTVSAAAGKAVFAEMAATGRDPEILVNELGLAQISDEGDLGILIDRVLANNPKEADRFRAGETKLLGFFMGEVMKSSGGRANPGLVNEILNRKLMG